VTIINKIGLFYDYYKVKSNMLYFANLIELLKDKSFTCILIAPSSKLILTDYYISPTIRLNKNQHS